MYSFFSFLSYVVIIAENYIIGNFFPRSSSFYLQCLFILQFFLELMKVPRVESKLRVFLFKIQFNTQVIFVFGGLQQSAKRRECRTSVAQFFAEIVFDLWQI